MKCLAVMITATLLLVSSALPIRALVQGDENERVAGNVLYRNGSTQPFTSFRCEYYSRLGHSQDYEAIIANNDGTFSVVTLDKIKRIDFPGRPNKDVRYGIATLFDGRTLETFFYVDECEWSNGKTAKGKLKDAAISALVFKAPANR